MRQTSKVRIAKLVKNGESLTHLGKEWGPRSGFDFEQVFDESCRLVLSRVVMLTVLPIYLFLVGAVVFAARSATEVNLALKIFLAVPLLIGTGAMIYTLVGSILVRGKLLVLREFVADLNELEVLLGCPVQVIATIPLEDLRAKAEAVVVCLEDKAKALEIFDRFHLYERRAAAEVS